MQREAQDASKEPWAAPGWRNRVLRWVRSRLRGTPCEVIIEVEEVRKWALSHVLRVRTLGGDLYFKAVPPLFASEIEITVALSHIFPQSVPTPVATDSRRNWMLLPDLGRDDLQKGTPVEEWCRVVGLLARMQVECVGRVDELMRAGCGVRRLANMADELDSLCADNLILSLLKVEDRRALLKIAPRLKGLLASLAEYGVPETLTHGDFHGGNIARMEDGRHVIFDWTDAAISHPFLDLSIILSWHAPLDKPHEQGPIIDAYLEHWRDYEPSDRLREVLKIAFPLGCLYQVLSYRRMIHALGVEGREQLQEGFVMWVERVITSNSVRMDV